MALKFFCVCCSVAHNVGIACRLHTCDVSLICAFTFSFFGLNSGLSMPCFELIVNGISS